MVYNGEELHIVIIKHVLNTFSFRFTYQRTNKYDFNLISFHYQLYEKDYDCPHFTVERLRLRGN